MGEDGMKFRVYRVGSIEARTLQEVNGKERIGAVFSFCEQARRPGGDQMVSGGARIVKVTQYVEKLGHGRGYFVVLETDEGVKIVTEKLRNMKVVFEASSADLLGRISSAKAVRSADCSAALIDVESMKTYQALEARFGAKFGKGYASPSQCKRYAHGAFNRAVGEGPL